MYLCMYMYVYIYIYIYIYMAAPEVPADVSPAECRQDTPASRRNWPKPSKSYVCGPRAQFATRRCLELCMLTLRLYIVSSCRVQFATIHITPSPPTKSLDFRGFDSSRRLILKGGNSHVR